MRKFNITVNGATYQVEVEEVSSVVAAVPSVKPVPVAVAAPTAAPKVAPAPVSVAAPVQLEAGDTPITSPMPGKVTKIVAEVGQQVQKGDVVLILEAMKMQNEIPAPVSGIVKSLAVTAGQSVKVGEVMAAIG